MAVELAGFLAYVRVRFCCVCVDAYAWVRACMRVRVRGREFESLMRRNETLLKRSNIPGTSENGVRKPKITDNCPQTRVSYTMLEDSYCGDDSQVLRFL